MDIIFGVFAYPDSDAQNIKESLFDELPEISELTEGVEDRTIRLARDEDVDFGVFAPKLDDVPTPVTPTDVSCVIFQQNEGGLLQGADEGDQLGDEHIDLLITIYQHLPEQPAAGYIMDTEQSGGLMHDDSLYFYPITNDTLRRDRFHDAAWVMVFTPALVEMYGRETLLGLPARRIDELDDGTIVVVAPGDPTLYTEYREIATELDLPAADERPKKGL